MKIILTAVALAIASPAVAQTAPVDPHAGHTAAQHKAATQDPKAHAAHSAAGSATDHAKHEGCCDKMADGKTMPCCDKMKAAGGKMECCEPKAGGKAAADPHAGHDMSRQ